MERNFYNNDFEEFLKQKADQYKMYPSDRVWNNIHSSLHGRRKWVALGFSVLFIVSVLFVGKQAVLSNYNRMAAQLNKTPEAVFSTKSNKSNTRNTNQYLLTTRVKPTSINPAGHTVISALPLAGNNTNQNLARVKAANSPILNSAEGEVLVIENKITDLPAKPNDQPANPAPVIEKQSIIPVITEKAKPAAEKIVGAPVQNDISAFSPVKPSKWFLQLYASPIISYRRLSYDDQQPYYNGVPVSASYAGNINRYVHHKPAPGLEVGGRVQYRLSNSLSVYAGLQLNYSRYYIDAYKYSVEKASIALNNARSPDTVSGYTNIRNFSGYEPEQLQNQYWQLSVPLGIEVKLMGRGKLQLSVAGGFQPTFLLNSSSYLITSDYKNYIQSPDLARNFNVHTNFEAFVSYQAGGFKWQLGPQFRSQLLSSYSNQYRVREYLTEFGIKIGVTKTLR